tara:strand:- start:11 stop:637 length:627 start_codon:yes stop_codon:yes gene_type:complete
MSWIDDFWNNISGGATTIATAPDPYTTPITITPTAPKAETTKMYKLYGQILPLTPSAVDYYLSQGVVPEPVVNSPKNTAFETLHPKQTQQLIKMGKDMTKMGVDMTDLGDIVTRQDVTDISHQEQINQAHEHRQILETRSQKAIDERADIHAKLIQLGEHKHDGTSGECAWYDLGCHYGKSMEGLGKLALIGVVAFFIFMLIKKRLGL